MPALEDGRVSKRNESSSDELSVSGSLEKELTIFSAFALKADADIYPFFFE